MIRPVLTVAEIREAVARIAAFATDGDDESAHQDEDALRAKVLSAIATNECEDAAACASAALATARIDFHRWCARLFDVTLTGRLAAAPSCGAATSLPLEWRMRR